MPLSKDAYQAMMNEKNRLWLPWALGFFSFEVEGVRSGSMKIDGSTLEQRAEDLKSVLPDLNAVNAFMESVFPDNPKARAKKIEVKGVACNDWHGDLIEITVPHISGGMYLGFIYSPDCAHGAQIPSM